MGKILTDDEFDALPDDAPSTNRVLSDAEFDALPDAPAPSRIPTATNPSTVAAMTASRPAAAPVDRPGTSWSDKAKALAVGAVEGLPALAKNVGFAAEAVGRQMPGSPSFNPMTTFVPPEARIDLAKNAYRQNADEYAAAREQAATTAPGSYAAGRVGSGIPTSLAVNPLVQGGLNAAGTLADGGTLSDAAKSAGLSVLLGKLAQGTPGAAGVGQSIASKLPVGGSTASSIGKYLSTASPRTAGAIGVGMSGAAAANSNAPAGDRLAALIDGLMAARGIQQGAKSERTKKGADYAGRQRDLAEKDVRAVVADETQAAGMEHAKEKAEVQADYTGKIKDAVQGAEALNRNVEGAVRSQVADAKGEFDTNKRRAQRDVQNRADARATADDAQQRVRDDEIKRQREENIRANDARRLSGVEHKIEMLDLREQHKAAMADYDAKVAAAKSAGEKVRAELDRADALEAIKAKAQQSYEREKARLTKEAQGEGLTLDRALASAEGRLRQVYGTGAGRTRDVFEMADQGLVPGGVDPRYIERGKLFGASLNENGSEETDIADAIIALRDANGGDLAKAKADWLAGEAQRRMEKANAGDPEARAALEALKPPTDADAQAALAEKERSARVLDPAVRARADEILKANGIDPASLTDEQIINREFGGPTPTKPAAPDDTEHQRAMLEFEKKKIESGRQPIPAGPDRMASRLANRQDRASVRNAPEFVPPEVNRSAIAADLAPGYPDMPAADKAPNFTDEGPTAQTIDALTKARIQRGRENVDRALQGPTGPKRGIAEQFELEAPEGTASQAARAAAMAAPGSSVGGTPGSILGSAIGRLLSRNKETFLHSNFLKDTQSTAGTKPGEGMIRRYSLPAEAAAILGDVESGLRSRSAAATQKGSNASRAALMDLLNNEGFKEWVRSKADEKKEAPAPVPTAPSLSGTGLPGGALVNPRIGMEVEKVLTDPETRAKLEEALKRYKIGMGASTPVIP